MRPRSLLVASLALAATVSIAGASPLHQIDVNGTFTAGGTLRDFTNKGGNAGTIDLTGLPVPFSLTFDLGSAPLEVFTAGTQIRIPFGQARSLFVTGQADIGSVVNELQELGNPADLPVPKILLLTGCKRQTY